MKTILKYICPILFVLGINNFAQIRDTWTLDFTGSDTVKYIVINNNYSLLNIALDVPNATTVDTLVLTRGIFSFNNRGIVVDTVWGGTQYVRDNDWNPTGTLINTTVGNAFIIIDPLVSIYKVKLTNHYGTNPNRTLRVVILGKRDAR